MQNQPPIPNPPQAITTKDLQYLKDAMSWELLAFKKFHFLAQHAQNQDIKQALDEAGRMHQDHYNRLLSHLQVDNNAVMSSIQNQQMH
ncbi:ferritin-like domain-containing protein [Bacillus sp. JJ1764]|uniref:ferritin-like domain-containing protein n=1 Tax=Bacillus sp. JJ1764 TaxID=3122964 RepID=UPI002FFEABA9